MARIRTIKPTLWASEKLGRLSVLARLNFVGLISLADDAGRGRGTNRFLIGQLHPYSENVSEQEFVSSMIELEAAHLVAFYVVDGCRYYALPGWRDHQYIEKWRKSELPSIPKAHAMAPLFGGESVGEQEGNHSPTKTPPSIPGKGMEGNGREGITDAPSASDFSAYRLKMGGEFKNVHVTSLSKETCERAIKEGRPNRIDRAALEWRIADIDHERGGKRSKGASSMKAILEGRA